MQIVAIWFKCSRPKCVALAWVYIFGKSNSLATLNTNKASSIFHYTNSSSHLLAENKQNAGVHTQIWTQICTGLMSRWILTHIQRTQVKINTPTLITHSSRFKKDPQQGISQCMLNFITLLTVSVYSWMCESASAQQQPSSCHYCSALYRCQNHRWQATFPGRSAQTLLSACAAGSRLMAIAPDTHRFHIFSLSMRRQREKRRQWKAAVIAINCQSHLHPEAQPPLNRQNKHAHAH